MRLDPLVDVLRNGDVLRSHIHVSIYNCPPMEGTYGSSERGASDRTCYRAECDPPAGEGRPGSSTNRRIAESGPNAAYRSEPRCRDTEPRRPEPHRGTGRSVAFALGYREPAVRTAVLHARRTHPDGPVPVDRTRVVTGGTEQHPFPIGWGVDGRGGRHCAIVVLFTYRLVGRRSIGQQSVRMNVINPSQGRTVYSSPDGRGGMRSSATRARSGVSRRTRLP